MRWILIAMVLLVAGPAAAHPCEAYIASLRAQVEAREARISEVRNLIRVGLLSGDRSIIAASQRDAESLRAEEAILIEERARLGRNEDRCQELIWAEQAAAKRK